MSRQRRSQENNELTWSLKKAGGASGATAATATSSSTLTSGGLYDLDTLNEDFVTAQRPSPSAFHDITEPKMDCLRDLNKDKATFKDMIRAADTDVANHAARMRKLNESTAAAE